MSDEPYGQPFLSTARSLSVATREFARLSDSLAEGVATEFGAVTERQLSVRRSPDRCIIQVARSAVTVAWIRPRRDSGEGELLIIHWRGMVAPAINQHFERARELTLSATPVYESVYLAEATCEADWMWSARDEPARRFSSASLAEHVIERLRIMHAETADCRASA
jgi:hypothetical protein